MKHDFPIVAFLIILFFCSQIFGLVILGNYVDYTKTFELGKVVFKPLPFEMERPEVTPEYSFVYIMVGVLIATGILMLIIKYGKVGLWKFWYFLSVFFCLMIALTAFFPEDYGFILALILGIWKVFRPNIIIHNLTEIFIYGGILVVFAPMLSLMSMVLLLLLISAYDMYAVWKSKHMVDMAQFLTESKTFAGLFVPYTPKHPIKQLILQKAQAKQMPKLQTQVVQVKVRSAVLGGGDIAFPLLFTSTIFQKLLILFGSSSGLSLGFYWRMAIVPLCTTIALILLFSQSKKDVFYPAMPFLSIGCFIGYGLLWFTL